MPRLDAPTLLRTAGLMPDGPVVWGRPVPFGGPGVYVVEMPGPLPAAPIELTRVGKWIERLPGLRLDGVRPGSKELAARMARYWLPEQVVLFVGSSPGSVGGRVRALEQTPLGDRRPYAGGQWLHALRGTETLRVWWAATDAPEETEDALLDAFAASATGGPNSDADPVLLPFAVQRRPTGERRAHGIGGSILPETEPAAPPTRITELPAAPEPEEPRSTGGRTRPAPRPATRTPEPRRTTTPDRVASRRSTGARGPDGPRPSPETTSSRRDAVEVSADGLDRLRAELNDLVKAKRPAIVRRVASARELGDLRENSEYHAAREELGFLDGRVNALEDRIRRAVVIDAPTGPHAGLGSTVVVEVEGQTEELRLVGTSEADPRQGRISTSSPVGRALVGRSPGDEVLVRTPSGAEIHYRLVEVR